MAPTEGRVAAAVPPPPPQFPCHHLLATAALTTGIKMPEHYRWWVW